MPVSHAKNDTIADWSGTVTVGNSTGGTTTKAASDLVRPSDWNSNHLVSISASEIASIFNFGTGLTSSTAAGGISAGLAVPNYFEPFPLHNTNSTISAPGNGTWYIDGPYFIPHGLGQGQINILNSQAAGFLGGNVYSAASTGSVTKNMTISQYIALYTQGTGANSSQIQSAYSASIEMRATESYAVTSTASDQVAVTHHVSLSFPSQFDVSGNITYGTTSQSTSTSSQSTTMASTRLNNGVTTAAAYVSGGRMDMFGLTANLVPGVYWMAHMMTSTSSTAGTNYGGGTVLGALSRLGLLENAVSAFQRAGLSTSQTSTNIQPFHGFLNTTTGGASSVIGSNNYRNTTGRMYWNNFQTSY